jgi:hypothetical protein
VGRFGHSVPVSRTSRRGVRGATLDRVDPLRGEWDVTVIGTHFAMAFVARDLGDKQRRHGQTL